jgi:molybdopterin molybdotransferase
VGDLPTFDEALRLVLERVRPLPGESVPLADAAGRFALDAPRSEVDLPPFPSSAMDGFAVRAADTPGRLPVVARIAAGRPATRALAAGEAMGIATGGVVPDGADAVVPIEHVVNGENEIHLEAAVAAGANVRRRGGDVEAGAAVVEPGVALGPAQLAALAAAGVSRVTCTRRPRAAVVVTGTELRAPGEPLRPGEIYESNGTALAAQLASAGAEADVAGPIEDDEALHRQALARGLEADVLVTTGGVSVGPHDLVRRIESELGVEELFWRVAVRPGKPVSFGVRGETLVFGLPGNPVSSLVGFELFVRPALRALQGAAEAGPRFRAGTLAARCRRNPARDDLLRAVARWDDGGAVLEPLGGQESHMIVRAAQANALVHVPRGEGELPAGSAVRFLEL